MQLLHETPVLTRDAIRKALTPPPPEAIELPAFAKTLADTGLADQVEQIKITPQALSTDEVMRLWMAFGASYRPSAAYLATVVLIESRQPGRSALPVRARTVKFTQFRGPRIDRVLSQAAAPPNAPIAADRPILPGDRLYLRGAGLFSEIAKVRIGDQEIDPTNVTDSQVDVLIPANSPAGVVGVSVVQHVKLGNPPVDRVGAASNVAPIVLRPSVAMTTANVTSHVIGGSTLKSGDATLAISPAVGPSQQVVLLLNELTAPVGRLSRAYRFEAAPRTGPNPVNQVVTSFQDVVAGDYLVRVQVDGAESVLDRDATGLFVTPKVSI
jgi:hypothetical protein